MTDPTPEQVREWAEMATAWNVDGAPVVAVSRAGFLSLCASWLQQRERIERLERVLEAVPVECEHEMTHGLDGFCYCTLCGTAIYVIGGTP